MRLLVHKTTGRWQKWKSRFSKKWKWTCKQRWPRPFSSKPMTDGRKSTDPCRNRSDPSRIYSAGCRMRWQVKEATRRPPWATTDAFRGWRKRARIYWHIWGWMRRAPEAEEVEERRRSSTSRRMRRRRRRCSRRSCALRRGWRCRCSRFLDSFRMDRMGSEGAEPPEFQALADRLRTGKCLRCWIHWNHPSCKRGQRTWKVVMQMRRMKYANELVPQAEFFGGWIRREIGRRRRRRRLSHVAVEQRRHGRPQLRGVVALLCIRMASGSGPASGFRFTAAAVVKGRPLRRRRRPRGHDLAV